MNVDKAIVYCERDGYRGLEMDLYRPDHDGPHPLLLCIHGGGWRVSHRSRAPRETRGWDRSFFEELVDAGFVVAANDYRFSSEAVHPAQVDDCKEAVTWLRANAAAYGGDADRMAVFGSSAGGHLAALVALDPDCGPIRGAACWYPVTDFAIVEQNDPDCFEAHLLGGAVGERPTEAEAAGPVNHVHRDAPPFHLTHGTDDQMVTFDHSSVFADALRAHRVPVTLRVVEGGDHFFAGRDDEVRSIFDETVAFLLGVTGVTDVAVITQPGAHPLP